MPINQMLSTRFERAKLPNLPLWQTWVKWGSLLKWSTTADSRVPSAFRLSGMPCPHLHKWGKTHFATYTRSLW
jgi:hypothetical protein